MIEIENEITKSIINVLFDYLFAVLRFDDVLDYFLFLIIITVTLFILFYIFKIIIYVVKDVFQLVDEIASAIFGFVGLLLAIFVGIVVVAVGIETFSIEKTTKFISNLFSKDTKINYTSITKKEVNEVDLNTDKNFSVFDTEVGLIKCLDGINEICTDDNLEEYEKFDNIHFIKIDTGELILIHSQVE